MEMEEIQYKLEKKKDVEKEVVPTKAVTEEQPIKIKPPFPGR